MKKTLLLLAILMCISYASLSQNTYYWVGGSGSENTTGSLAIDWATSWNTAQNGSGTARTVSSASDTLIFDGNASNLSGTKTIYIKNMPVRDSAAQLKLMNGVSVRILTLVAPSALSGTAVFGAAYGGCVLPVTGTGTRFDTTLRKGDYVYTTNYTNMVEVLSVSSATDITVANEASVAQSGSTIYRANAFYIKGSPGLVVNSGCNLGFGITLSSSSQLGAFVLALQPGATGIVNGDISFLSRGNGAKLVAQDPSSLVFASGSNCNYNMSGGKFYMLGNTCGSGSASGATFAFTTGSPAIVFQSGANFRHSNIQAQTPFGASYAATSPLIYSPAVSFQPNSNYYFAYSNGYQPYFFSNNATFGNLIWNSTGAPGNASTTTFYLNPTRMDTLTINSMSSPTTSTNTGKIVLYGDFINNSSTTCNFGTMIFADSTKNQKISGTNTTDKIANLIVKSGYSLSLNKNITVTSLASIMGKIDVGTYTITGTGATLVNNNSTNRTYNQASGSNQAAGGVKTTANSTAFFIRGVNNSTVLVGATITSSSHPTIFPAGTYVASYSSGGNFTASSPATITADSTSTPTLSLTFTSTEGTVITANASGLNGSLPSFNTYTFNNSTNYTFNGSSAQVTGTLLPLNINNLTISNPAGVTLSGNDTVKGTLTVSSGTLATGATNFSLGASASATLAAGTRLVINGGATDFNSRSVTIQANASSTAAIINTGALSNATNVTLQQWVTGQRGYRVLSNPFSTALTPSTVGTANSITITGASDVKTYNTSTNVWTGNVSSIAANTPYSVFIRGLASEVNGLAYSAGPTAFAYNVTGTLNGNSVTLNQNSSNDTAWTISGNPFAAPVKSSALTGGTAGTPYYVYSMAQNNTGTRVKAGGWVAASSVSSTTTRIPMMGVVAYQAGTSAGSTFSVASTSIDTTTANTIQTGLFGEGDATTQLELQLNKDGVYQDKLFVRFDANSTEKGTERMDLPKLNNDVTNIYTITSDKARLAVDARKGIDATIPVGITSPVGKYTFTVASNNFVNASNVYLVDKLTNTKTALVSGATYSFEITSDAATQGDNRFELGTVKTQVQDAVANDNFSVKVLGNVVNNAVTVQVRGAKSSSVQITVVDMQGKLISNTTSSREINNLALANGSGMYLIKVTDGENSIVSKVVKP